MKRILSLAMALILVATVAVTTAFAADIRILGANPVQEGLHRIAEQFKRDTGHNVTVQISTTGELNKILAAGGEGADMVH